MNGNSLALARSVALAKELADRVKREGYAGEPSLYAGVLAQRLAGFVVRSLDSDDELEAMQRWIAEVCGSHPLEPKLVAMLASSCESMTAPLRGDGHAPRVLGAVRSSLARAIKHADDGGAAPSDDLDEEIDGTIAAFLVRLDEADPLSAEHSRAVSLWCRRIATRMNLDDATCRFVARSGLLHDVGKSQTPRGLLSAPRALSESEWVVMRDHTVAGSRMIAEVRELERFETAARSHHERLDGKGYPDALSARDIALPIRIVSVADSFNAMIGRRPYRLPMSPAQALEQLVTHRGRQFDPFVVEAMIDVVERPASLVS